PDRAAQIAAACRPARSEKEPALVTGSFAPTTLSYLLGLRDAIRAEPIEPWQMHLKWCLLGALRDCASVKVGWPYQRPKTPRTPRIVDPSRAFIRRARWMAEDLASASEANGHVNIGDSRTQAAWAETLNGVRAQAVLTSPP